MKKYLILTFCTVLVASCNQQGQKSDRIEQMEDSLQSIIDQKDRDLNELMETLTEIQEGFAQVNEAEGRVNALKSEGPENTTAKSNILENMQFIEQTMAANRQKISELQQKLKQSGIHSAKLKSMIDNLSQQLEEKSREITDLRNQLAEKDIQIEELTTSVDLLKEENAQVKEESENNAQIARNQDAQLNTAWYACGTKSELKEHNILDSGDVLRSSDFDQDYFTKIDIRTTTVIPLASKYAKVLTTHPEESYTLLKDSKGEYTLRITDAYKFWSVSRYLVVRVK